MHFKKILLCLEINLCKMATDAYMVTVVSSGSVELMSICRCRLVLLAFSNVSLSSSDCEPLL